MGAQIESFSGRFMEITNDKMFNKEWEHIKYYIYIMICV